MAWNWQNYSLDREALGNMIAAFQELRWDPSWEQVPYRVQRMIDQRCPTWGDQAEFTKEDVVPALVCSIFYILCYVKRNCSFCI